MLILFFDDSHELLRADQFSMVSVLGNGVICGDVDIGVSEVIPR